MKKIIARVLVVIFILVAIFVTVNLLAYNDYEVAEFGNSSLVLADEHLQDYGYQKGDLIIVSRANNDSVKSGDSVMYYDDKAPSTVINVGTVSEVSEDGSEFYVVNNDSKKAENSVKKERVLGSTDSIKVYSKIGSVLNVLESRTGYLLIILLPTLALFTYLIKKVVVELKEDEKKK